jgi:hypothetical protein
MTVEMPPRGTPAHVGHCKCFTIDEHILRSSRPLVPLSLDGSHSMAMLAGLFRGTPTLALGGFDGSCRSPMPDPKPHSDIHCTKPLRRRCFQMVFPHFPLSGWGWGFELAETARLLNGKVSVRTASSPSGMFDPFSRSIQRPHWRQGIYIPHQSPGFLLGPFRFLPTHHFVLESSRAWCLFFLPLFPTFVQSPVDCVHPLSFDVLILTTHDLFYHDQQHRHPH